MTVLGVHHVALRTARVALLVEFYGVVLGLAVDRRRGDESVWLAAGGAWLMIERRAEDEPAVAPETLELVAWSVTEEGRAVVRARLRERGLVVEAETAWTTYFRDPDGRRVAVSCYPAPP